MFSKNQWVYPLLFGEHSYYKPPLTHWLMLTSWKVFGLSYGAAILPFVIALFVSALLFSQLVGVTWAGFFLVGNIASLMFGFTAQMEVLLLLCVVAILWSVKRERWFLAWTWTGVASLAKSPTYAILFGASILIAALLSAQGLRTIRKRAFLLGIPWALALGLSWYLWVWSVDRDAFVAQFLVREHTNKLHGNGIGFFQMLGEFSLLCLPATFLIPYGLVRPSRLSLALGLPLLAFLIWTPYRMDAYVYPLLPVILWHALSRFPRSLILLRTQGILIALAVLALISPLYSSRIVDTVGAFALALGAVGYAWASHPKRARELGLATMLLIFVVRLSAQQLGEQDIRTLREFSAQNTQGQWSMYDATRDIWHEAGFLSTAIGKPIERVHSTSEIVQAIRGGSWVILEGNSASTLTSQVQKQIAVRTLDWKRWKRGLYHFDWKDFIAFKRMPQAEWEEKNQKRFVVLTPIRD